MGSVSFCKRSGRQERFGVTGQSLSIFYLKDVLKPAHAENVGDVFVEVGDIIKWIYEVAPVWGRVLPVSAR